VTLRQSWANARRKLADLPDIDNPELESEILLRHALDIGRTQFYLDLDKDLSSEQSQNCSQIIERRLTGEPAAYIIGRREFFGLDFNVDRRVLIPRPETELLVEETLRLVQAQSLPARELRIVDIGTGSGAIAISLAVNLPQISVLATDISADALVVAAQNCLQHAVADRVTLRQGDLLEPLTGAVDILIANLPYVTAAELEKMPSVKYEPRQALDGGESGLATIFRLLPQVDGKVKSGGDLLMEIGLGQSSTVKKWIAELYPSVTVQVLRDLAGIERVVKVHF